MRLEATALGRTVPVEIKGGEGRYTVTLEGRALEVDARASGPHLLTLIVDGRVSSAALEKSAGGYIVHLPEDTLQVDLEGAGRAAPATKGRRAGGPTRVTAPMPGRLVRVLVEPGQEVRAGQGLVVMEAMKMENELRAPRSGRVAEVPAREREAVETGAVLVVLE
jgi:biotin carboxyl carrier protein